MKKQGAEDRKVMKKSGKNQKYWQKTLKATYILTPVPYYSTGVPNRAVKNSREPYSTSRGEKK